MARLKDEEIKSQVKDVGRGMFVATGEFKRVAVGNEKSPQIHVEICCDSCGNVKWVPKYHYLRGSYMNCRCSHLKVPEPGSVFGKWVVITGVTKHRRTYVRVRCECGNESVTQLSDLIRGRTKMCVSCGHDANRMSEDQLKSRAFEVLFSAYRRNAARNGREFNLSFDQFISLVTKDCAYSGHPPMGITKPHQLTNVYIMHNGLDRVDNERGYTIDNVVPCCYVCNRAKLSMPYAEWSHWLDTFARDKHGS